MAQWNVAYNWMLDNEDRARAYNVVPDAPPGAFAISGINSASFPSEFDTIAKLMISERGPEVEDFYRAHFWNQWYAQLTSDDLCKRVFDFAVNAGSVAAVRCLQRACNSFPIQVPLIEDGGWGPLTVAKVNILDPDILVAAFQQARIAHYKAIVAANPEDAQYLSGWLARAMK
jgi:lysozyme family protein